MGVKERAAVLLREGRTVLLIHRVKFGSEYHVVPGGGIEDGETPLEAAVREMKEETNLDVDLMEEAATSYASGRKIHYFVALGYSGTVRLGGPELDRQSADNIYTPQWVPVGRLDLIGLRPEQDLALISGLVSGSRT